MIAQGSDWNNIVKAANELVNEKDATPSYVMNGCISLGQIANSKKNYKQAALWLNKARQILIANNLWASGIVLYRDLSVSQWLLGQRKQAAQTILEGLEGMDKAGRSLTFYFTNPYHSRLAGFGSDVNKKLRAQALILSLVSRTANAKDIAKTFDLVKKQNTSSDVNISKEARQFYIECLDRLATAAAKAKKVGNTDPAALAQRINTYRAAL
jgi:hypothetical protein